MSHKILSLLLACVIVLSSACQATPGPTPTPTRTPRPAATAATDVPAASPQSPAGATDTPAGRTGTPVSSPTPRRCAAAGEPAPPAATARPGEAPPTPRPTATTVFNGKWPQLASPEYGIQAFWWWRFDVAQRDANLIRDMGFQWVKHNMAWTDIELARGEFDWCAADQIIAMLERKGLSLLVRLDDTPAWAARPEDQGDRTRPANNDDFGNFCYQIASRYAGRVRAYQVWNEPNLDREWGMASPNPAEYVQLLKACYEGIKRGDPHAIVISAGLAPTGTDTPQVMPDIKFLEGMYAAGGAAYFDMLGFNAPGYAAPPEMSPDEAETKYNGRWFCFRHVEDARAVMVANGDADKQLAILEMGWTTDPVHPDYSWFRVDDQTQADYLVRAYQYAKQNWQPWIGLMSMIYISDPFWTEQDEQYWWSITYPNFPDTRVRPAYDALRAMPK
jgi:hypothetical protein